MEYVELHAHTNFSWREGASQVETLAERAAAIGLPAFALTDYNNLSAAVRYSQAVQKHNLRPLYGSEITLEDGHHLLLLVKNQTGWRNLCTLITLAQHAAPKEKAALPLSVLDGHTDGLIALSGGRSGAIADALLRGDRRAALAIGRRYVDLFGKANLWIELNNHRLRDDRQHIRQLVTLAHQLGVGYVATNNVLYAEAGGHNLQDILVAIKNKGTLEATRHLRNPSREHYLKSADEMAILFKDYPDAISNTVWIAEQCQFDLKHGIQELPDYPVPGGLTAIGYLRQLCLEAIPKRYAGASEAKLKLIRNRLDHELGTIARTHSEHYFLLVWDICRFARESGIRYSGRGSGANSMVAYLLYISPVDPLQFNLVFERFLSDLRQIAGDFDIDFESRRRPEVIQYLFNKYGVDHAAMASTFVTYKAKSALRDVAKAFGIPVDAIPKLREELDVFKDDLRNQFGAGSNTPLGHDRGITWKYLIDYAGQLYSYPRHMGQHNGGFVITKQPLHHYIPTEPTAETDLDRRYVVQWDKDALEDIGWMKVDVLGLKILDVISACLRYIEESTGEKVDIENLRYDDPRVYRMIGLADTVGVFQLDSRAQSQNLPFHRPSDIYALAVAISLIRPGPIIAGTVKVYYRRLLGREPVTYLHPSLEAALGDSLGVILWQEQVALVAHHLAGFSLAEGEQMRRSLGKDYAKAENEVWEARFMAGALARGVSEDIARKVFGQIKAFGGYAFSHAHAAAFAVLVYQSAYLKCYYPAQYGAAILNNSPVGFWSPGVVVNDLRRRGINVLPVSINKSDVECAVEKGGVRLGFNYVATLGETGGKAIVEARGNQPFADLADFYKRAGLPESEIENLILCGAMAEWKQSFRQLHWQLGMVAAEVNELGLKFEDEPVELPPLTRAEKLQAHYETLGLSPDDHMLSLYRDWLDTKAVITSQQLRRCKNGERVRVAGMALVLQRPPTAKGTAFLTIQDEYLNMMDAIISPSVYDAHKRVVRKLLLVVEGRVQRRANVINIVAERIYDLQDKFNTQHDPHQPYSHAEYPRSLT